MTNNVAAALCYLFTFVTGILFLVLKPYNQDPTVRFHAFQAIFLGLGMMVVGMVVGMIVSVIHLFFLFTLVNLAFLCLWLYMMFSAYQGKMVVLPVIGPLAQKQK